MGQRKWHIFIFLIIQEYINEKTRRYFYWME